MRTFQDRSGREFGGQLSTKPHEALSFPTVSPNSLIMVQRKVLTPTFPAGK